MNFKVKYLKVNPDNSKNVRSEKVDITGEFYHRLDNQVMCRKAKVRIAERLGNSDIKEIISISSINDG